MKACTAALISESHLPSLLRWHGSTDTAMHQMAFESSAQQVQEADIDARLRPINLYFPTVLSALNHLHDIAMANPIFL